MLAAPRNLLTEWARLVAASLVASGVHDVIVSPGSRSTPFVLALRARSELRLVSVIDERSAAFVALGIGRATGRAAAVLATSGTAPAHWVPAVIEASLARVPLVLLSANRPLALANAGAAQTIDQTKLFGGWVRLFADLGDPRAEQSALEGVVRTIAQAVAMAHEPLAGPVHVDLHADKPLEPVVPVTDAEHELTASASAIVKRGVPSITAAPRSHDEVFARALASALTSAQRPLVVVGPRSALGDRDAVHDALARLDLIVCAEASSQLRFGPRRTRALDASEVLFASSRFANEHAPDLVLQIGALPTAPSLERAWQRASRFILDAGGFHDPIGGAAAISLGPAGATMTRVAELAGETSSRDDAWRTGLLHAEAIAWAEVERSLSSARGEGACVRAAARASGAASLVIGNSLAIRTLDRFVPGGGVARRVFSQRGANGIDGLVSGAIGVALAGDRPVLAVVGDVSFLHDANALGVMRSVQSPLVVVVVDNGGGRIFESLPIAGQPELAEAMTLFTTPHDVDLSALTRAFGVRCVDAVDATETAHAVTSAIESPGASIVRVRVLPREARDAFESLVTSFEHAFYGGRR